MILINLLLAHPINSDKFIMIPSCLHFVLEFIVLSVIRSAGQTNVTCNVKIQGSSLKKHIKYQKAHLLRFGGAFCQNMEFLLNIIFMENCMERVLPPSGHF